MVANKVVARRQRVREPEETWKGFMTTIPGAEQLVGTGNVVYAVHTQCKIFYIDGYLTPSFGLFPQPTGFLCVKAVGFH